MEKISLIFLCALILYSNRGSFADQELADSNAPQEFLSCPDTKNTNCKCWTEDHRIEILDLRSGRFTEITLDEFRNCDNLQIVLYIFVENIDFTTPDCVILYGVWKFFAFI